MSKEAKELLAIRTDTGHGQQRSGDGNAMIQTVPAQHFSMFTRIGLSHTLADVLRKAFAEFICMTIFVFIGVLVCQQKRSLFAIALTHGLMIAALVCAFGHISGAHINPAVTLAVLITRQMRVVEAAAYVVAQLLGSLLGAFLSWAVTNNKVYMLMTGGAHGVASNTNDFQCFLLEVIVTATLVLVILMCAVDQKECTLAAIGIGFTVAGGIIASGPISGGSLNPARSFGPLVTYSAAYNDHWYKTCLGYATEAMCNSKLPSSLWRYSYIHFIGPLVGGALAAGIYHVIFHGIHDNKHR